MTQEASFSMTTKNGEQIVLWEGDGIGAAIIFITTPPAVPASGTLEPDEIDKLLEALAQMAANLRVKAKAAADAEPIAKT